MIEPGASSDTVAWMIASASAGALAMLLAAYLKTAVFDRLGGIESSASRDRDRREEREDRELDRALLSNREFARLQAQVEVLMEDRERCDELAERTARLEAFQQWAEPLLEKAVDGLQRIAAFEAKFEEQLTTLFKGMGAITARLERNAAALYGAQ